MPLIRPLAIDGAAPSTTTNRIAPSVSWNSRIASGNHAIDGIVCRPVIIEPIAGAQDADPRDDRADDRADDDREGEALTARVAWWCRSPSTIVVEVARTACRTRRSAAGRTYSGFQPDHTTSCQRQKKMATASELGPVAAHDLRARATRLGVRSAQPRARRAPRARRRSSAPAASGDVLSARHGGAPPRGAGR